MVITCPHCKAKYRIETAALKSRLAKVKCPGCSHLFEVSLVPEQLAVARPSEAALVDGKPLILVVDDARFFREMIRDILSELPIEILTAADGDEAWALLVDRVPQLVLLDLNIPGKSGREILLELQGSPLKSKIRVLAMSAVDRGDLAASEMRRLGAVDFLSKSFTPAELRKRVRSFLDI